ncbi:MAG: hypothetical protein KC731_04665 [Myxococcales bacterium]|nr:hypothetical protein [Myxococcales bacterium]
MRTTTPRAAQNGSKGPPQERHAACIVRRKDSPMPVRMPATRPPRPPLAKASARVQELMRLRDALQEQLDAVDDEIARELERPVVASLTPHRTGSSSYLAG